MMYRVRSFERVAGIEQWLNEQAAGGYFLDTMTSHYVPPPPENNGYSPMSANRAFIIVTVKRRD